MGFLVADGDKNMVLYMYQPESRESFGGRIVSYHISLHNSCTFIFHCEIKEK
jgi:cleavage and polyadenylation specificity factor subunit 1